MTEPITLPRSALQPLANGTHRTLWSFSTDHPLEVILDPLFLTHQGEAVVRGDQIQFSCGPAGERVHGTMVVLDVTPKSASSLALVRTEVLTRTRPAGSVALKVAR